MINAFINLTKGRVAPPKQINFQKISKRRLGPSSIQKFMLQILGLYKGFLGRFPEKICNIIFRKFIRFGIAIVPKDRTGHIWAYLT